MVASPHARSPVADSPPAERRVDLPGRVALSVREWGPEAPVVPTFLLVHGLASNARLWDGVAGHLAAAGHRVVAVDQRGHGRSDASEDLSYDAVTGDLVALCRALELDRPVLAGQSWGGNVVIEAAARHPDAFAAVACVDGGFIDLQAQFPDADAAWEVLTPPRLAGRAADDLRAMMASNMQGWPTGAVEAQMGNFAEHDDGTVTPRLDLRSHEQIVRQMYAHPPTAAMPHVDVPVLLLPVRGGEGSWGEHKAAAVRAAVEVLPDARLVWLEGAHDVHLQHPDVVAGHLLDLAAQAGGSRQ